MLTKLGVAFLGIWSENTRVSHEFCWHWPKQKEKSLHSSKGWWSVVAGVRDGLCWNCLRSDLKVFVFESVFVFIKDSDKAVKQRSNRPRVGLHAPPSLLLDTSLISGYTNSHGPDLSSLSLYHYTALRCNSFDFRTCLFWIWNKCFVVWWEIW